MGQKVSPHGLRVGVIKDWNSRWYAGKENFASFLAEDDAIRKTIKKAYYGAGISKVVIERPSAEKLRIRIEILQSVAILFAGRSRARQVRHNIDYMVFNNPT